MIIVNLLNFLGFDKQAFTVADDLLAASNRNRLRPGWKPAKHDQLKQYVDNSPYQRCPKCLGVTGKGQYYCDRGVHIPLPEYVSPWEKPLDRALRP